MKTEQKEKDALRVEFLRRAGYLPNYADDKVLCAVADFLRSSDFLVHDINFTYRVKDREFKFPFAVWKLGQGTLAFVMVLDAADGKNDEMTQQEKRDIACAIRWFLKEHKIAMKSRLDIVKVNEQPSNHGFAIEHIEDVKI